MGAASAAGLDRCAGVCSSSVYQPYETLCFSLNSASFPRPCRVENNATSKTVHQKGLLPPSIDAAGSTVTTSLQYQSASSTAAEFTANGGLTAVTDLTLSADLKALQQAADALRAGLPVAIPTETVYGLAANALSAEAVRCVFAAKGRPSDNPLIVHVSSLEMLAGLYPPGWSLPQQYVPLVSRFWPGPLTILLPRSPQVPDAVTAGQPTMAVRFPDHPVACALIKLCGFPLAAPSANSSGRPSPTTAAHVMEDLFGKVPIVLDGGPCSSGVESTVLDALRCPPAILRPGGVTYEQLRESPGMEGLLVYRKDFVDAGLEQAPSTPGMKYRHYSPDAQVVLLDIEGCTGTYAELCCRLRTASTAVLAQLAALGVTRVAVLRTSTSPAVAAPPPAAETALWHTGVLLACPASYQHCRTEVATPSSSAARQQWAAGGSGSQIRHLLGSIGHPVSNTLLPNGHAAAAGTTSRLTAHDLGGLKLAPEALATAMNEHSRPMVLPEAAAGCKLQCGADSVDSAEGDEVMSRQHAVTPGQSGADGLGLCSASRQAPAFVREYMLGALDNPRAVAHELFAALRAADEEQVEVVVVEGVLGSGEGLAVLNRARKAASRILHLDGGSGCAGC